MNKKLFLLILIFNSLVGQELRLKFRNNNLEPLDSVKIFYNENLLGYSNTSGDFIIFLDSLDLNSHIEITFLSFKEELSILNLIENVGHPIEINLNELSSFEIIADKQKKKVLGNKYGIVALQYIQSKRNDSSKCLLIKFEEFPQEDFYLRSLKFPLKLLGESDSVTLRITIFNDDSKDMKPLAQYVQTVLKMDRKLELNLEMLKLNNTSSLFFMFEMVNSNSSQDILEFKGCLSCDKNIIDVHSINDFSALSYKILNHVGWVGKLKIVL